jgi:MYXO-CTERM domain-containing protein
MPCVARVETDCDPRGEPCFTNEVKRCSEPSGGPGSVPGGRAGCGCEVGAPVGSVAGLALAALMTLLVGVRRRYS